MFVYVLKSLKDGSHYVGLTDNVDKRLIQHNIGKNYSTKSKRPWVVIHVEVTKDRIVSRKLEKYFKSGHGREVIKEIEGNLT